MKQLSGSLLFILLYFTSCQMIQSNRSKAEQTAVSFCEAFYNFDYTVAGKLATATSLPYIRFFASNITQEQLDKAKERGPVTVTIVGSHADDETSATVICQIEEPLKIDFINGTSEIQPDRQDTLYLVKEGENWLVRMDSLPQSETQSRD